MQRNLTLKEEIFINQYVQHLHSTSVMKQWFADRDYADKRDIILNILNMVIQAHPTYDEMERAANELGTMSSPSAIKLLNKSKPYSKYGYELANLPEKELTNSFILLLSILSIADNRRKNTTCTKGCRHWWHQDLSDQTIVQSIINQYAK